MNQFKIGDEVKVVKKNRSTASYIYFGKTGKVIRASKQSSALDIEKNEFPGGFWNDELELVVETDWDN